LIVRRLAVRRLDERRIITASLLAGLVLASVPRHAHGEDTAVKCTVRMILAEEKPSGGLDKRLAFLKKQFSQPPFSAYKTISLLEVKELSILQGQRQQLTLPNGKLFRLTFKERLLGRKNRLRLRMHLSITPPKETRFLPGTLYTIGNKGLFLVGGDKHKGGTLVIATTCQAK
jgi:hypothetical protein